MYTKSLYKYLCSMSQQRIYVLIICHHFQMFPTLFPKFLLCNFWNRLWSETYHEVFVPRLQSTSELCGGNGTRLVDQIRLHTYCVIPQGPSICPFVSETIFFCPFHRVNWKCLFTQGNRYMGFRSYDIWIS